MESTKNYANWSKFIATFNDRYKGSPTRLGVFKREHDSTNDYWIENGLPLEAVDLDIRGDIPTLRVALSGFSHEVRNVLRLTFTLSTSGDEDGIDILDDHGRTTVLRIEETYPPV